MANVTVDSSAVIKPGRRVVFRDANDRVYVIVIASGNIRVYKGNVTGEPASFAEQDATNAPNNSDHLGIAGAIDSAGLIHIIYYLDDSAAGMSEVSLVRYATFRTSAHATTQDVWDITDETVATMVDDNGNFNIRLNLGVAIDANDDPHVAFEDNIKAMGTSTDTMFYANKIGGSWNTAVQVRVGDSASATVDLGGIMIADPASAVNADRPILLVSGGTAQTLDAFHGTALNATAFTENLDVTGESFTGNGSMAIDSNEKITVTYFRATGDLKIIEHLNSNAWSNWETPIVVNSDNYNAPSIAIDGTDRYIFALDTGNNDIRLFQDTGSGFTEETADTDLPNVGTFNDPKVKWSNYANNSPKELDYVFEEQAINDVFYNTISKATAPPPVDEKQFMTVIRNTYENLIRQQIIKDHYEFRREFLRKHPKEKFAIPVPGLDTFIIQQFTEEVERVEVVQSTVGVVRMQDETVERVENNLVHLDLTRIRNETVERIEGSVIFRALTKIRNETVQRVENFTVFRALTRIFTETVQRLEDRVVHRDRVREVNETVFRQEANDVQFSSLQARIKCNDAVVDSSGNSNNGTWTGTEQYVDGQLGRAADLDGSSYFQLDNEDNFDYEKTNPFSVAVWVKIPSGHSSLTGLVNKSITNGSATGWKTSVNSGGEIRITLGNGGLGFLAQTTEQFNDDQWHHVVCTFQGNSDRNGIRIYVDGIFLAQGTDGPITGSILSNNAVTIGATAAGTSIFTGVVDDVQIYDKQLSLAEISQMGKRYVAHRDRVREVAETVERQEGNLIVRGLAKILNETVERAEVVIEALQRFIFVFMSDPFNTQLLAKRVNEAKISFYKHLPKEKYTTWFNILTAGAVIQVLTETVERIEGSVKSLAKVIIFTEAVERIENTLVHLDLTRIRTEIVQRVENFTVFRALTKIRNETVQRIENRLVHLDLVRIRNETVQRIENNQVTVGLIRFVNETVQRLENTSKALGIVRVFNETVQRIENVFAFVSAVLNIVGIMTVIRNTQELLKRQLLVKSSYENRLEFLRKHPKEKFTIGLPGLDKFILVIKTETVQRIEGSVVAKGLIRIFNETVERIENTAKALGLVKVFTETVERIEATAKALGIVKIFTETVERVENILSLPKLVVELVMTVFRNTRENLNRQLRVKAYKEQEGDKTRVWLKREKFSIPLPGLDKFILAIQTETVERIENTAKALGLVKVFTETVNRVEGFVTAFGKLIQVNETVQRIENTLVHKDMFRFVNEIVQRIEGRLVILDLVRIRTEIVQRIENVSKAFDFAKQITEVVQRVENNVVTMSLVRIRTETVQRIENFTVARNLVKFLNETVQRVENIVVRAISITSIIKVVNETVQRVEGVNTKISAILIKKAIAIMATYSTVAEFAKTNLSAIISKYTGTGEIEDDDG